MAKAIARELTEAELYAPDLDEGELDVEHFPVPEVADVDDPYLREVWAEAARQFNSGEMDADQGEDAEEFADSDNDVALVGEDGQQAEQLLAESLKHGKDVLADVTASALKRFCSGGPKRKIKSLYNEDELDRLTDALAAVNATGELLGRARVQIRAEKVKQFAETGVRVFCEDRTELVERFNETGLPEVASAAIKPRPPLEALSYFRKLVPSIGVDVKRFGPRLEREAFTLARQTEQVILDSVQSAIAQAIETGELRTGQDLVTDLLKASGVAPDNPQYAEMVFRTNVMDAYNEGAAREMASPEMQELFPVWQYLGIRDGRQGKDHEPKFNRYYPAKASFGEVRGDRPFNCRCTSAPISFDEWAELQKGGARAEDSW